jgi:hypothetical protein
MILNIISLLYTGVGMTRGPITREQMRRGGTTQRMARNSNVLYPQTGNQDPRN